MLARYIVFIVSVVVFFASSTSAVAIAAKKKRKNTVPVQTSLVVDGRTGKILHSRNARVKIYPASLTKVMTLYMIFEALESGKLRLNQKLYVSKYASHARPLKLYLKPGERITVKDVVQALVVRSANDAARVAAENIAGSEKRFARLMTIRARQLGMRNTTFTNASGLHDPRQKTTAVDLAKLSIAVKRDFHKYYTVFFAKTSFKFKGRMIHGHNKLTSTYPGAEGLKTGFTNQAGRNLITTATRGGKSLVGVVTGSHSVKQRDKKMVKLLDHYFKSRKKKSTISRRRKVS